MSRFLVSGKIALITGGNRGIGLGAAKALGESGAKVILVARDQGALEQSATGLCASGIDVNCAAFDLARTGEISTWYEECVCRHGRPEILVNAAGITRRGDAINLDLADWSETLAINATAVFELSRVFARSLIEAKARGKIVNIASLMTAAARRGTSAYAASKGALGQLTKALAIEWASHGIHVNAIAPGYIDTEMSKSLREDPEFDGWVKKRCPLGRWGSAEDIAWPIVFLASPASDFITGQVIYVDGGWLATF
ncbi:MAG: SDR family oxidoreductase [Terracidiphilus sp.]|jgi:gluconate 5-dehydrogenase